MAGDGIGVKVEVLSLCQSLTLELPHAGMHMFSVLMRKVRVSALWHMWVAFPFGKTIIMCAKIYVCFSARYRYRKYLYSWSIATLFVLQNLKKIIFFSFWGIVFKCPVESLCQDVYRMFADLFSTHCPKSKMESFSFFLKIYFSIPFFTTSFQFL